MPKGVIINDKRKQHREQVDGFEAINPTQGEMRHIPTAAPVEAMERADKREFTQKQLMRMVAARFRPGPKRFLIVEDYPITKVGKIIVPKSSQKPSTSGRVCSIGEGITGVKKNDHVVYAIFAGTLLPLRDVERVRALQESEIMCWVNDDAPAKLTLEGEVE